MAQVAVPAGLVRCVRETGLLLYGATAEALQLAIGGDAAVEELRRHRERLTGLGALLDQLGWEDEVAQRGVELVAPPDVLGDVLHGALIDAGERLAAACGAGWRGDDDAASVRAAAREVIALDRLLRELEAGA